MTEFDPHAKGVTIPQLKARADQLGLKYTSKVRKADLIAMIEVADMPAQVPAKPAGRKGLHYRGRALGLKHYRAMGLAIGRNAHEDMGKVVRHASAPLPNSERVQNYARTRRGTWAMWNGTPRLTPRQMRRVRKNANKHSEGFTYGSAGKGAVALRERKEDLSLLARTPDGLGIFHKFSEGV